MSSVQTRRTPKHLCLQCRERKARFRCRGAVRADRDHTLCFECYLHEMNHAPARRLADRPAELQSPLTRHDSGSRAALNEGQLAHRRRMLEHLQRQSLVAT